MTKDIFIRDTARVPLTIEFFTKELQEHVRRAMHTAEEFACNNWDKYYHNKPSRRAIVNQFEQVQNMRESLSLLLGMHGLTDHTFGVDWGVVEDWKNFVKSLPATVPANTPRHKGTMPTTNVFTNREAA